MKIFSNWDQNGLTKWQGLSTRQTGLWSFTYLASVTFTKCLVNSFNNKSSNERTTTKLCQNSVYSLLIDLLFIYYVHKFTFQWNHINIRTSTTFHFIFIQFHSIHVVCFWQLFKLFFLCFFCFFFVCLMFAIFSFCSFLYQHKILFCIWKTCMFQKLVCFKQENRKFQSKINKEVLICCWWSMLLNGLKGAFRQGLGAPNYPLGLTAAKSMKAVAKWNTLQCFLIA